MTAPNVLLVVLDSVRAGNCGLHGHDNETTPFLGEFADEATVFEQARAPGIHSIASHASVFSGYHVEEHRLTEHESYLAPSASIWNELGVEHEYETGIFSPNYVVMEASNLTEPFDTVVGPDRQPDDERDREEPPDPAAHGGDVYVDDTLDWVRERTGPWAACLNLMDAHYPYVPKPEHDRWGGDAIGAVREQFPDEPNSRAFLRDRPWGELRAVESLYDGCVRQADALVERLVSELERAGALEDTLLVITSDHGEGFGERSRISPPVRLVDHSWGLHESLTHVPLLVREPGQRSGESVSDLASLTRFPAVVGAALRGDDAADEFIPDGRVLSSTYRVSPPADYFPIPEAEREPFYGPWRAVYREDDTGVLKYAARRDDASTIRIRDAQVSYRVADGADGVVDRVYDQLGRADVEVGDSGERDVDETVEDRLRELGYVR